MLLLIQVPVVVKVVDLDRFLVQDVEVGFVMDIGKMFSGEFNPAAFDNDSTRSDDSGEFTMSNLAKGEYKLQAGDRARRVQGPFGGGGDTGIEVVIRERSVKAEIVQIPFYKRKRS